MPLCQLRTRCGVLRLARNLGLTLIFAFAPTLLVRAEKPVSLTVSVVDKSGAAIPGANVQEPSGQLLGRTDTNGQLTILCRIPWQRRHSRVYCSFTAAIA